MKSDYMRAGSKNAILDLNGIKDQLITIALSKVDGHRAKAAKMLGISTRALQREINKRRRNDEQK